MKAVTNGGSKGGKPFQSKLELHTGLIRDMRTCRKSYREIARYLREEHGISVDATTIWSFVKVRSKPPRKVITMFDPIESNPKTDPSRG